MKTLKSLSWPLLLAWALLFVALLNDARAEPRIEAGVGMSRTNPQPNGTWYQEGFPYTLDLTKKSFYLGLREQITPTVSAHINYVNFGVLHADAMATPVDANYDPVSQSCIGPCVAQSHFVGSGRSDGVKFALQWNPNGFGLIGGLFVFKPRWQTTVYNWTWAADVPTRTIEHSIKSQWVVRPVIGVAYRKDAWEMRLEQYFNKPYSSTETGIARSTTMLTLGYTF